MSRTVCFLVLAVAALAVLLSIKVVGQDEVLLVDHGGRIKQLETGVNFIQPLARVRRYKLNPTYRFLDNHALILKVGLRSARIEGRVAATLDRDKVISLDRDFHGAIFEKLIRPLLLREFARVFSDGFTEGGHKLETVGQDLTDILNEKTRHLGVTVRSVQIEAVSEEPEIAHNLERGDGFKVFILGLDGYDWLVYDLVTQSVGLKNMARLRHEGAWGNLRSIEPLVSPLIWTTMVTGVTPDVHGITDFLVTDTDTGEEIPVTSWMRRVPALWNMTSLFDMKSGFIGWFASFPAEQTRGFIVTDRVAYHMFDPGWREGREQTSTRGLTYPPELYAEIETLLVEPREATNRLGLYIEGPVGSLSEKFNPEDPVSNLRLVISAYKTYESIMTRLYPERKPDLFGIYFEFTDSVGHMFMRHMSPPMADVPGEDAARFGGAMAAAYAEADRILGEVLGLIDETTVLIIVSDHGFKSGDMRPHTDSRIGHGQAIEWHRINGAIAMYGAPVKGGYRIPDATVMDIAPTVLYLLGLPVDTKMTGRVLLDALDASWVDEHPVRYTSAYDSLWEGVESPGEVVRADQTLKDKLVSLGYVAGGSSSMTNLANYYHKNGQYDKALDMWKKIADENPADLGARIGMSNAYFELGREEAAISGLEDVLKAAPKNLKALQSLATIHIKRGKPVEALEVAEEGLRVDPNDGQSHFNKGSALQLLGRNEEAAHEYRQAIKYVPDLAEAYANLAQIYVGEGRTADALSLAEKGVELGAGKAEMHYVLGMALGASGRRPEALRSYLDAIKMDRDFMPSYIAAGGILLADGKPDSAIALCDQAPTTAGQYTPYLLNIKGAAYAARGDMAKAKSEFQGIIRRNPEFSAARLALAQLLIREGDRNGAAEQLEHVLSTDPSNRSARDLLDSIRR